MLVKTGWPTKFGKKLTYNIEFSKQMRPPDTQTYARRSIKGSPTISPKTYLPSNFNSAKTYEKLLERPWNKNNCEKKKDIIKRRRKNNDIINQYFVYLQKEIAIINDDNEKYLKS